MPYAPDYAPGTDTPHGWIFDEMMKALAISEAAVVDAVLDTEALLARLPDRQIAYELTRVHRMLGLVRAAFIAEDLMYRFANRRNVLRVLRATYGSSDPDLTLRLLAEAERPGCRRRWALTSLR